MGGQNLVQHRAKPDQPPAHILIGDGEAERGVERGRRADHSRPSAHNNMDFCA